MDRKYLYFSSISQNETVIKHFPVTIFHVKKRLRGIET